ncbi:hypothetical protein [Gluconobacter japonicus]|nr:hypothetical protein [Gluconobacter japonicus]
MEADNYARKSFDHLVTDAAVSRHLHNLKDHDATGHCIYVDEDF